MMVKVVKGEIGLAVVVTVAVMKVTLAVMKTVKVMMMKVVKAIV